MRLQGFKWVIACARPFGERCLRCLNSLDRRPVRLQVPEVPCLNGIADCLVKSLGVLVLMLVILTLSISAAPQAAQQGDQLEGVVLDQLRKPVPNARVVLSFAHHSNLETLTGADGRFLFESVPNKRGALIVDAPGFARFDRQWSGGDAAVIQIEVILVPAPISEQVTITATRIEIPLTDTATSVRVLSSADLASTGALALDDALRQVPGFQLFRRSGSRTANPTSQGISLRGVGASGASRALVLADGIPLNDPFGGWVYWGRIPRESLSRVEVLRGGASDLYGSGAMGGVIGLVTKRVGAPVLELEASYGNQRTPDASLFMGGRRGKWGVTLAAEQFKTNGYITVADDERGPIDTRATSRRAGFDFKLQYEQTKNTRFFLSAAYFGESRGNGTPLQINRTHIRQVSAGVDWQPERVGAIVMRLYGSGQVFDQTFSSVAANRNSETLTRVQRVPAQVTGLTFQWSRAIGSKHTLLSGVDAREVRGASDEIVFVQNRTSSLVGSGGRERDLGVFLKDIFRLTARLSIVGGARLDHSRNYAAHSDTKPLTLGAAATVKSFSDRAETAVSPQVSILYKPREVFSIFASAYRAFRTPTLNELYRSFRVGNVFTLANESLAAERLAGGEGGVGMNSFGGKVSIRGSLFWSEINQPIANVTVSNTPGLITRQRRNLGRTRSRGIELESELHPAKNWSAAAGYLFADARVIEFPANHSLEGLAIPQLARHSFSFQLQYTNPSRVNAGLQGRIVAAQFDDDLNLFRLPRYSTIDVFVSRRLNSRLELFTAAENLLNQRYVVGRTPVTTFGPPLLLRAGFRLHLGTR